MSNVEKAEEEIAIANKASSAYHGFIKDFILSKGDLERDRMDMTTLLRLLIESGKVVYGLPINGGWCEVDTAADLSLANSLFEQGLLS